MHTFRFFLKKCLRYKSGPYLTQSVCIQLQTRGSSEIKEATIKNLDVENAQKAWKYNFRDDFGDDLRNHCFDHVRALCSGRGILILWAAKQVYAMGRTKSLSPLNISASKLYPCLFIPFFAFSGRGIVLIKMSTKINVFFFYFEFEIKKITLIFVYILMQRV